MGSDHTGKLPLETKAITAVIEELERQAADNPSRLQVRRNGEKVVVAGEIDVDALVMVVVGYRHREFGNPQLTGFCWDPIFRCAPRRKP